MIIYSGTRKEFHLDVLNGVIAERLKTAIEAHGISGGSEAEYRSWMNSLSRMDTVISDPAIPMDALVALEYQIPTTSKRIDFMIAGNDEQGKTNIVLIELKQWEEAARTALDHCVKAYVGGAVRVVQHPCAQVYNYAMLLENINAEIYERGVSLIPMCYLHNYKESFRAELEDPSYAFYLDKAHLFLGHDGGKLQEAIKARIKKPTRHDLFEVIEHGTLKPSKALQDSVLPMLEGKEEFFMLDEQQVAYSTILHLVEKLNTSPGKHTIVIQGGPGTGKSVIAVSLLAKLLNMGHSCAYVTKNAAPRNVFSELLIRGNKTARYVANLFKGSGSFIGEIPNRYDCLLVDEAHRLNEKSGLFANLGENQIKEIIMASKVSVFFLDEDQIVTARDIGSMERIRYWAEQCGSTLIANDDLVLRSQFRCNGSNGYIAWLDHVLGIRSTANVDFRELEIDYDLRLYRDPNKMREDLRKINAVNNKARILAGYCYDWVSKKNPSLYDIRLPGGFHAQWNFNNTSTYAIDPDSFDQIGCIHTSQGLEFDYVGVIIGPDLTYHHGLVDANFRRRSKDDASVKGLKSRPDGEAVGDRIVRNTYKTLLSRGQKGCFIYCEDAALADRFVALGAKEIV